MNGIIVFKSNPCNIGDYMQSLAASKFYNKTDYYIEREKVSSFKSDIPVKTIMNAWWMWSKNWPPSNSINPLFVSVHISPESAKWILSEEGIAYLKQHSPIGCRDLNTLNMMKEKNIDAYFSGCLTLTLGKNYHFNNETRGGVTICDPYYKIDFKSLLFSKYNIFALLITYYHNKTFFQKIRKSFGYKHKMFNIKNRFVKLIGENIQLAFFYKTYRTLFTEELIKNATYTSQWIETENEQSTKQLLEKAEVLLQKYAHAKMVITSRIHCALPSLGCDTPVLFVTSDELKSNTQTKVGGRLGGLDDFFNLIVYKNNQLSISPTANFNTKEKISSIFRFSNKETYISFRDSLFERCNNFTHTMSPNHD